MQNFIAVLKDSFREAVDGFVIYVMLGLAAITIIIAASVSFDPDKGDTGFQSTVSKFEQVFRNRGTDNEEVATRVEIQPFSMRTPIPLAYTASDVQKLDAGASYAGRYKLRLKVSASDTTQQRGGPGGPLRTPKPIADDSKLFPTVVYSWSQAKTPEQFLLIRNSRSGDAAEDPNEGPLPFEVVPDNVNPDEALAKKKKGAWLLASIPKVSPKELESVTDDMMEDFIKNQFLIHGDLPDATAKRRATTDKGTYEFDVEVDVKPGSKGWPHTSKIFFGAFTLGRSQPLGPAMFLVQDTLVNTIGASILLLVSVILTGFFIPNMLRKGSLDLLVAKPMARWQLLLFKYIGGLIFVFLVTTIAIGGVWIAMAIRSGNWSPSFLLSIPIITFTFAVLYAFSTLLAVLTRSAIVAILLTSFFMVFLWGVGFAKTITDGLKTLATKEEDKTHWFYTTIDVSNMVLPRYNDLLKLNSKTYGESYNSIAWNKANLRSEFPSWWVALGISIAYIAGMLALAYWRFATRDP